MVLLEKTKLSNIDVFIALIDSNISHDEFVLVNKVLKEWWWSERINQKFNNFIR